MYSFIPYVRTIGCGRYRMLIMCKEELRFGKTPNPAWPPPSHFLPSQPERMKDLSVKSWSAIAGSGPVPWRQAPNLFNGSNLQSQVHQRVPFEIGVSGGNDRFRFCGRLSTASPEMKQESSYERLVNEKLRHGPFERISSFETLQYGNAGVNRKEHLHPSVNDFQQIFQKKDSSSSNLSLVTVSSSKAETDDTQLSAVLSHSGTVGNHVCWHNGMHSSGEAQIHNGKTRGDGRGRNQLLPRYRPQITNEELQQISSDSKSVITPLFEKMLSASDAGRIGRLVLPKKCAEAYFPPIAHPEGLPLKVQDVKGKEWLFQYRFWPNNNSRMYVLEGITPCIQAMQLQAGDVVTFSRLEPEGKLVMGGRKASVVPSSAQGDEGTATGRDTSIPKDDITQSRFGDVMATNHHMKCKSSQSIPPINKTAKTDTKSTWSEIDKPGAIAKEILEANPVIHSKRKKSSLGAKSKRKKIEDENMIELKLTWNEAQRLMRPLGKTVPSVFVVEGCEFEEFEEAGPVIGRPTIQGIDHLGEKIQWVQCEDCFKWRKVPADALLPWNWICSENLWDVDRSLCSVAGELATEQLKDMLFPINKVSSNKEIMTEQDSNTFVALEALDALANLAIQGEGDEDPVASSETKTKHPRHKIGCSCIVCLQPPSGKNLNHKQSCECVVCSSLRRRFRTSMERREKKQMEKELESTSQNLQWKQLTEKVPDIDELNGGKFSDSPLKGQVIDLNIQPEREEESSPTSDSGCLLPDAEGFFRQQTTLGSNGKTD
ncbi:hypothetical protein ACJIZ3_013159 [Penstemon smallii]|uniref:Uncharacterized protein n=1 Tax=Penstemon smallii TaxID=265156 RepID=A0ABD3UQ62_9LAMI